MTVISSQDLNPVQSYQQVNFLSLIAQVVHKKIAHSIIFVTTAAAAEAAYDDDSIKDKHVASRSEKHKKTKQHYESGLCFRIRLITRDPTEIKQKIGIYAGEEGNE